jgi:ATP/maltotriose-dependent transcriptional regulator MalT
MGVATVKTHLIHIFEKIGVENRASAMLRALETPDD